VDGMRKEVVLEEVCMPTTFFCSIAQKLPSFFFLIALDWVYGELDLEVLLGKEHWERNGAWVNGITGTVTEWTSELHHFIILAPPIYLVTPTMSYTPPHLYTFRPKLFLHLYICVYI
jgi:hypothetical protein